LRRIVYTILADQTVKKGDYGVIYWDSTSNVYEATEWLMGIDDR
jgi:hypothetical protein